MRKGSGQQSTVRVFGENVMLRATKPMVKVVVGIHQMHCDFECSRGVNRLE